MIFTVEWNERQQAVEIYCDTEGVLSFIRRLEALRQSGGHEHFMTPAWAGNELTEGVQGNGNELLHHLVVAVRANAPAKGL